MSDSNIKIVQQNADKYGLGKVYPSSRKDKKYMILDNQGHKVHFGAKGYADYTGHKDEARRDLFRKRNAKWANSPKGSPSWLSFHILW